MAPTTSSLPRLAANAAALLELLDDAPLTRRVARPLTFSCNARGEVWWFAGNGLTPLPARQPASARLLEHVVDVFLAAQPAGGRFWIDPDTLRVVAGATRMPVAEIQLRNMP